MRALETTMRRTAEHLRECVGDVIDASAKELSFLFGSTRVYVSGSEDGGVDGATFVHLRALIARHVPITDQLYRWIATASNDFLFGHVTLAYESDEERFGELNLRHTLLGDHLDLEEVRTAVAFLAATADQLDDVVVDRFGGKRYADLDKS